MKCLLPLLLIAAAPVTADPPRDSAHPAAMAAFVIPAGNGAMNAVLYLASGSGPHPTLLLLHGFPGNEQNLDLAQAARRNGWNVLTLHYRGSWGSPGAFSLDGAADDAATALAFLQRPEIVARYRIDPRRIAIAGHSMGGTMAASAAAGDRQILGAFLIDPWDIAATGRFFRANVAAKEEFVVDELRGDMPPLAGTSEATLLAQIDNAGSRLDLARSVATIAPRPVTIIFAERGAGLEEAARLSKAAGLTAQPMLPTDHSFSDMRIALAERLVAWLDALPR